MSGFPEVMISGVVQVASPSISIGKKRCTKCRKVQNLDGFHRKPTHKDGRASACKVCQKESSGEYYKKNKTKILEHNKQWYKKHPEHVRLKSKKRRIKYPEKLKEADHKKYIKHRDRCIEYSCRYAKLHPEEKTEIRRRWARNNPDKIKAKNKRLNSTPAGKINMSISGSIRESLHGNKAGRHWEDLVGYTVDQLKQHLEKLFQPGMTWGNQGSYWQIDHKIPLAVHNFECPEDIDFKKCWALSNLQPLEAKKNAAKRDRLSRPFQPSLCIEG